MVNLFDKGFILDEDIYVLVIGLVFKDLMVIFYYQQIYIDSILF